MGKTNIRFIVYNAYGIGGTVKTIFNFANYFHQTGRYNVEIISIKRTGNSPTLYVNPNIKISVVQDSRRGAKYSNEDRILLQEKSMLISPDEELYAMFSKYTDKRLLDMLSKMKDGILVTTIPSFNMLATQYVDKKVLCIGQEHKSLDDHTPAIQNIIREYYGKLDALTILTNKNLPVYRRIIPQKDLPINILANATDPMNYQCSLDEKVVIAAGRYSEVKGYDMLIKAFAMIAPECPEWKLKIYGQGDLISDYQILIRELNVQSQIILAPATEKMMDEFSKSSLLVCSSNFEGFGMTIIEGFSIGIPCVSFACEGPCEIITDGYDGFLVEQGNIQELANKMLCIIKDENLRKDMGNNAFATSKQYNLDVIGKRFEEIIEKALIEKKRRNVKENIVEDINKSRVTQIIDQINNDKKYDSIADPDGMIVAVGEGKVGIKTILSMTKNWVKYKIKN